MTKIVYSEKASESVWKKYRKKAFYLIDSAVFAANESTFGMTTRYVMQSDRKSNTVDTYNEIIMTMLKRKVGRDGVLIAVGGGKVHDIGGFVASTYLRGIKWVYVPTTLVGMADSCIGGRCGLYFEGKDCAIGSTYPPECVYIDYSMLKSLPSEQWDGGVCEIIKTSVLSRSLLRYLEDNIYALHAKNQEVTRNCLDMCRKTMMNMLRERILGFDRRYALKIGRTLGVALEAEDGKQRSRGEYVIFGMILEMSMFKADISPRFFDRVFRLIDKLNLKPLDFSVEKVVSRCFEYSPTGILKISVPRACGKVAVKKIDESTMLTLLNQFKIN